MKHFIGKQIVKEIDQKKKELDRQMENPLRFIIGSFHQRSIENEAVLHSFKIEHPDKFKGGSTLYDTHVSARKKKIGIKALNNAMAHGKSHFKRDDPSTFNEDLLLNVAGRIGYELFGCNQAEYRSKMVRISGANWTPPYPGKIEYELSPFFYDIQEILNEESTAGTLEAAAFAHLHLDRIHPFEDYNGRTSRTLQNIILHSDNLPPPIIYSGERFDYYKRLQNAINGYHTRRGLDKNEELSDGEQDFYNYIASLVSASFDRLLD